MIARRRPERRSALHQYAGPSKLPADGRSGSTAELVAWMRDRPGELAIGGETASWTWDGSHAPGHLAQDSALVPDLRRGARLLCAHALRRFGSEVAAALLPSIREAHPRAGLSQDDRPAIRRLRLRAHRVRTDLPLALRPRYAEALDEGWLEPALLTQRIQLSSAGREFLARELPRPD